MYIKKRGLQLMDWKTVFTIIGSFGAASTAQIINHRLTQKREDKKYIKECLQNFYAPLVYKYIDFIKGEGLNNSPIETIQVEFTNKITLFEEIIKITEQNLKYADAELINVFQELKNYIDSNDINELLDDLNEDTLWDLLIEVANSFFANYIKINKKLNTNIGLINSKFEAPYLFVNFYLLIREDLIVREASAFNLFNMYDLINFVTYRKGNNYLNRIIMLRKELNKHGYLNNQNTFNSVTSFSETCNFIYELLDEFEIADRERSQELREMIDEGISIFY